MGALLSALKSLFAPGASVTIDGERYRVGRLIAEGGFSYVYEAHSKGQLYALKRIHAQDQRTLREARDEIAIHKKFAADHPHLLRLYGSLVIDSPKTRGAKDIYMLFPYYPDSLLAVMQAYEAAGKTFSERELLSIFLGVCEGLAVFHHASPSWAHRDVKPGNVLLDAHRKPVLMDFGSAAVARVDVRNRSEALSLQELAGERCTMPYRAPELFDVASECVIDERTDVWSVGCTLYAMAFLYSPFEAPMHRNGSVAMAVQSGTVDFPETSNYSKDMHDLILFAMTRDPETRPTIDAVIEKTKALLQKAAPGTSASQVEISIEK